MPPEEEQLTPDQAGDPLHLAIDKREQRGQQERAEARADVSWHQGLLESVNAVSSALFPEGGTALHGGRRGAQALAGAVGGSVQDRVALHNDQLEVVRDIGAALLPIMQATNPDMVEEAAKTLGMLNRHLTMTELQQQRLVTGPYEFQSYDAPVEPAQETGGVLADSYGPYHPEYRSPSIAVDRAPGISGGAITNVSNNFGGLMIVGGVNSGGWEGRLTVGSEDGAALLAAHQEEDAVGRKAWIYDDQAKAVLSEADMAEYYENPSDDKWEGMKVVMSAKGGYYEVFEDPVQGLRGAIENTNSRIVRYGENTPGQLIATWAPEMGGDENPVGSEAIYAQRIARLVGDGEIDPTNWQHMAGVILAMAGHEAGRGNAPDISAELLYAALQSSEMATGEVVDGVVTVAFGRTRGDHGMGEFSLEDVQDLLDRLSPPPVDPRRPQL